jgi:hypothetical protein
MHLPFSITNHSGLIKNIKGIDYHFNNIPHIITLFHNYYNIEETDAIESLLSNPNTLTIPNIILCLAKEIEDNINSNSFGKIKLGLFKNYQINEITSSKGLIPVKHTSNLNEHYIIINIGRSGPITFKNANQKYTFYIDNGSLLLINDEKYEFMRNITPFINPDISNSLLDDNKENQKRFIITLYFNKS